MKRTIEVLLVALALVEGDPTHVTAQGYSMPQTAPMQQRRPVTRTATAPTSLMAAYAMSSTIDASGNNRTALFTDMSTVSGKYDQGQHFNGSTSRMAIPTFNVTSAFTIECWVSLNVNTRTIVGRSPREPYGWQAIIYKNSDNFFIAEAGGFVTAGFTPTGGSVVQITSPTTIAPLAFHHVAATYDGAGLTLYVDGVQTARVAATGSVAASSEPIEVGGSSVGGYLGGTIDDVRIYGRALTAAEIASDMATPVDIVREDVVSWDVEVFTKDAPSSSGGAPIVKVNFPRSAALCGQAPLTPPAGTVQNPATLRVSDPAASGKECELAVESYILKLPAGVGYTSTARARGATTVADRSPASNPFDRVDIVREDVVSWDIEMFSKDAPSIAGGTPVAGANFLRSGALCGLAPLTPPVGTVRNPTTARVSDPAASGKECEVAIETLVLGLPMGVGYTSTARARGATTVADRSAPSNPFDRAPSCQCR